MNKDNKEFTMTEQEMRNRIKEIDNERDKLREEKLKYEEYFFNKKRKEALDNHKSFIGKCFVTKGLSENQEKYIKAFKIIEVLDNPNENYALCVVLIDGYRYTCWNEYGIQIMTLALCTSNTRSMISKASDPLVIDLYKEFSQSEFESLYKKYQNKLDDKVYS